MAELGVTSVWGPRDRGKWILFEAAYIQFVEDMGPPEEGVVGYMLEAQLKMQELTTPNAIPRFECKQGMSTFTFPFQAIIP